MTAPALGRHIFRGPEIGMRARCPLFVAVNDYQASMTGHKAYPESG